MDALRILAIADTLSPALISSHFPDNLPAFDMLISAGDIPNYALAEMATRLESPPLFVLGNHTEGYSSTQGTGNPNHIAGCINLHRKIIMQQGITLAGLEGCGAYKQHPQHYSDHDFSKFTNALSRKLLWQHFRQQRGLDILVTHAPPQGKNAGDDRTHRGIPAFSRLHKLWKPTLHIHGHVHLYDAQPQRTYQTTEGIHIMNVYGYVLLEFTDNGCITVLETS